MINARVYLCADRRYADLDIKWFGSQFDCKITKFINDLSVQ